MVILTLVSSTLLGCGQLQQSSVRVDSVGKYVENDGNKSLSNSEKFKPLTFSEKFESPSLTRAEFTKLCAEALERSAPANHKIDVTAPLEIRLTYPDKTTCMFFLENAWKASIDSPGERQKILEPYLATLDQLKEPVVDSVLTTKIVPLVRTREYFGSEEYAKVTVSEPLGADLLIVYGIDSETSVTFLTPQQRAKVKLSDKAFRANAIDNLCKIIGDEFESKPLGTVEMLTCKDDYESSLILFPKSIAPLTAKYKGPALFSIPSRDVLLITDGSTDANKKQLRNLTNTVFNQADHIVSDKLYLYENGKVRFAD